MLYYRFRPPTEISFKELLYSEIYFASQEECNDPFDSKPYLEFPPDQDKWEKLFRMALHEHNNSFPEAAKKAASQIVKYGAIAYEDALLIDYASLFEAATGMVGNFLLQLATDDIKRLLELYKPRSKYFVSFSKSCKEPLMWSHYAGRHEGFCLVFRSIDGALSQDPDFKKRTFTRSPEDNNKPSFTTSAPERFEFREIRYVDDVNHLNAFEVFPDSICMKTLNDDEKRALSEAHLEQFFMKNASWSDEDEVRISLSAPLPWLYGDRIELTQQERLFHYNPDQLVGIIFGARMSEGNKLRLKQVIDDRQRLLSKNSEHKRILFNFYIQEAKLSTRHRELDINPVHFVTFNHQIKPDDHRFDSMLAGWLNGEGHEIHGQTSTRILVED